jgi:NADPH-dependent 2,4-dienoyl-CoA reductase/sulfur reductase-like enzyme
VDVNIIEGLIHELQRVEAEVLLETTFIGLLGSNKVLVSPKGVYNVDSRYLVLATGSRSLTPAKLGWTGRFPAGIVGLKSALRLLSIKKLVIGHSPIIYGSGLIPEILSIMLSYHGVNTTLLIPSGYPLHLDENKLVRCGVKIREGIIRHIYGKDRVEYVVIENGEKIEGDSIVIGIREPDTLPIKFRVIDRMSNGPAIHHNFASHEDKSIYVIGSAAGVFDDPNILIGMAKEFSRLIDKEPSHIVSVSVEGKVKYVIPRYISESNEKIFLRTIGYPRKIYIGNRTVGYKAADEHIIDISDSKIPSKNTVVIIVE